MSKQICIILILTAFCSYRVFATRDTITSTQDLKTYFSDIVDFDTVYISNGEYKVRDVFIKKHGLTIIGINNPVLDADNESGIITVEADNVTIKGITFRNTGISFVNDVCAIRVQNSKGVKIQNNTVENSFFAIYLSNTTNSYVDNNVINGNSVTESFSGNGIHLWNCNNILVSNNTIKRQRDGIYLEFAKNSVILNNASSENLRYGLHFMFSEGNKYVLNKFSMNGAGVAVMYTKRVEMIWNNFFDNWGENAYGLLLKDIDNSLIYFNNFKKNTVGIYSEGSNKLIVQNNRFENNGWAMKILGNCYDDVFSYNTFRNNIFDLATNSSRNTNKFEYNYWDKYNGYDLEKDGIGDVAYRPMNLFSLLIETSPDAIILLNSFMVNIIDFAEKVSPAFTPETLIDERPLMKDFINAES